MQSARSHALLTLIAVMAGSVSLGGCVTDGQPKPKSEWINVVIQSAVPDPKSVVPPLTPILSDRVHLVTWKKPAEEMVPTGTCTFKRPVWATVSGELRNFCRQFVMTDHPTREALQSRLEQLLGLRPGDGAGREIIEFDIDSAQVFRPCPDPSIDTVACQVEFDEKSMKTALDKDSVATRFLLEQMLVSYVQPEGYPFTRRGFTFDWAPSATASHQFGLSEYVTRPNAAVVILTVTPLLEDYCRPDTP